MSATAALPDTGQASELGRFIKQNEQELTAAITAALGLGGPWALTIGWIVGWIVDECLDPWAKNRDFRSQLDQANRAALIGRLSPVQSRAMPTIEEGTLQEVTIRAEASWTGSAIAAAPVVIPWDQTVTLSYMVSGHAASPCHQDLALVQILGVERGNLRAFFRQEAEGIARLFNPETVTRSATASLALPAGGYVLQAAVSGDNSTARIAVTYETAQIKPELSPLILAGVAGLLVVRARRRR